ncbi:short-chain dehydrogenase TIC 32, chloroplastic-like isoform X3 [Malania oleifera]|uniref:short-chain dehydrogenase TIC 32, chloroplastic-like isoform X3 n=1 Tax=Malania oleifera TaxID=397392 RepID=UPI0025ADE70A|nr:short-chain dehydrogenase TIC 32, chloroplastic-like isoform X3 [Malania oleifera]
MWPFSRNGASGFSSSSTAEEVTDGIDGSGLTAIVTGATSGIGAETARVLALRGVHVIMGVRRMTAASDVKEAIVKEIPNAKIEALELDLSSLASVRKFASDFNSLGVPLNILINNAGIMGIPFTLSKDNIEMQFATNYVGHFLLTNLLLDTMKKTAHESGKEGRIVSLSSYLHRMSYSEGIRFDRINDESGYKSLAAYGQSKLASLLHANELARRLEEDGAEVTANSLHPGIVSTNINQSKSLFSGNYYILFLRMLFKGAATTCYLALNPQVKGVSGEYFENCNSAKTSAQARDAELAKKLWDFSTNLVK